MEIVFTIIVYAVMFLIWAILGKWGAEIAIKKGYDPIWGTIIGIMFGLIGIGIYVLLPNKKNNNNKKENEK